MLPYLIAGAIGFGIGKLFEEGGETFGRGGITTNEGIIKSFLNSNKELRVGNLEAVEIDDIMYLRNYRTFIAKRMGDKVKISSQKYSQTTSKITNRLKALAQEMGYSVEYVSEKEIYDFDKFVGGGEADEKLISIARAIFNPNEDNGKIATSFGKKTFDGFVEMIKQNDAYDIYYNIWSENAEGKYIATTYGDKTYMGLLEMLKSAKNEDEYAGGGKIKVGEGENKGYLLGYEPYFEKYVWIASIDEDNKIVSPTHGYFPKHPLSKKAINWAKKNGYDYMADGKKYYNGGGVEGIDLENYSDYDEFYDVIFEYVKKEEDLSEEETKDILISNESIIEAEFDSGSSPRFTADVILGYLSNERTFRRGGRTPKKVIKVRARGGYSLEDFFPLFEVYKEVVSYKKVGKLELQQIIGKKDVSDEFEFKTEADRDYWFEILNKEQEKYFTVQNKKKYVKYVLDNFGNYSEEAEDNDLKTLSEKLDYFADDLDYDLRLNTTREDFIYYLDLDVKDKYAGGGGVGDWSVSDITNAKYLGVIEFQDNEGEFHNFEVMETDDRLVFGGMTNSGFIESGYIEKDGFSTDETLQSLIEDLEVYYNDGGEYTSQIVFNQRMAEGGEAKKRRRRANIQTGRTDRSVDKTRVAKPVGYRFTNSLASKLRKDQYAVPTEKQITKYLGKGIYKENRKNRSDRDRIAKL